METLAGDLEKGTAIFLCLIDEESEHHEHCKYSGQVLFPVSVVVFECVVLIL